MEFNLEQIKGNYDILNNKIAEAKAEMRASSETFVELALKQLFDNCPEVEDIHWVQYTPYFNDGEECTFSVHDICFRLFGEEEDLSFYESSDLPKKSDLELRENDLKTVQEFEANPVEWKHKFLADYKQKYNREYRHYPFENIKPWPSTVAEAQERVDHVKGLMEKYSPERCEFILAQVDELSKIFALIGEEILEHIYGDHVSVVITRDGTEVQEYSHD